MTSVSLVKEPTTDNIIESVKNAIPLPPLSTMNGTALQNTAIPGFSSIYRNSYTKDNLLEIPHPSLKTLHEIFTTSAEYYRNDPCFGSRHPLSDGSMGPYEWNTYSEVNKRKKDFGSGLFLILQNNPYKRNTPSHLKIDNHLNIKNGHNQDSFVVSLFSSNRIEWCIADIACIDYAIPNTALYDTLGPHTSRYILKLTESPVVICSKENISQILDLKKTFPKELSNLISIISMDSLDINSAFSPDRSLIEDCKSNEIIVSDFELVERFGERSPVDHVESTPDTIYTISFTSGTTGANPKGVVLTNKTAVASITCGLVNVKKTDRPNLYCFLPLAHIAERWSYQFGLSQGAAIGFPHSKSPLVFFDDIKVLKPHLFTLVPRIITKLESLIKSLTIENDRNPLLKKKFTEAITTKIHLQGLEDGAEGRHPVHDVLIDSLRKELGLENLIGLTTAAAPISADTIRFIKASLNVGMFQGYGLTESFAGICSSSYYDANPGSCGPISVTGELKLREVPEMNYYANDVGGPRGEILVRGAQIFKEYFKNPKETSKALDSEGWFYTGDIARIDESNGRVYVIDRVKNCFKLAQGEYITPEKVETIYSSDCPLIEQCYVHGDSLQTYLVAIIGIDSLQIKSWLTKVLKIDSSQVSNDNDLITILNQFEVKKKLLIENNKLVAESLSGLEIIHNVYIDIEPLTTAPDIFTPTLKIKRPIAQKYFADRLEQLYQEGSILKTDKSKL